ncbi:MAG: ribosome-associated translation inhibitor RaiA [Candidatus Cloacimonetes bacterium]|nr:ribosome-associated translation inhibitor RaiA [Candidatus Cloacimonadota bacterium]
MQITITARHFELTNAIRDHVEVACEKLARYFDHISTIHITLDLEDNRNIVEMSLHAKKFSLQSEAEELDMYLAIDSAIDKMESQIKKLKEKVTSHQKKGIKRDAYFFYADTVEKGTKEKPKKRVKMKKIVADYMTTTEAVDTFSELDIPYMIFKNTETDRINVIVRKDNEHIELLQP